MINFYEIFTVEIVCKAVFLKINVKK